MSRSVFIVSGEESGDLHGSALIRALRQLDPSLRFGGMGGWRMREAGLEGLDSKEVSVVGLVEVAGRLPAILKAFKSLKTALVQARPSAVVLIDFPDFNLRFAKEAKKQGVPIIYYISPQVWAWRASRLKKIAGLVDKMLVVFPFEVPLYEAAGVDAEFVGHPLADSAVCNLTQGEARRELGLADKGPVIALAPGSRRGEVQRLLPVFCKAARILVEKRPGVTFVLPAARSLDRGALGSQINESGAKIHVIDNRFCDAMRASDVAIVASGTATLECALVGTPMVIAYRFSPITYMAAKALVKVESFGLPNIVAGKRIVPELLQDEVTPERLAQEAMNLLEGEPRKKALEGLGLVRGKLGTGGATINAAKAVMKVIGSRT